MFDIHGPHALLSFDYGLVKIWVSPILSWAQPFQKFKSETHKYIHLPKRLSGNVNK